MLFSIIFVKKEYFPITNDHGCVNGTKSDAFSEGLLMTPALRSLDGSYTWKRTLDFFHFWWQFVYICITLEINSSHDLTEWTTYSARKKLRHKLPCSQRTRLRCRLEMEEEVAPVVEWKYQGLGKVCTNTAKLFQWKSFCFLPAWKETSELRCSELWKEGSVRRGWIRKLSSKQEGLSPFLNPKRSWTQQASPFSPPTEHYSIMSTS